MRAKVVLPILVFALLLADMNLMAPNLTAIGQDFGFTRAQIDRKLGADINLLFWLFGGAATLLVGFLTDRSDLPKLFARRWLLLIMACIGQTACLLSGLARSYDEFYWARILTSIGVGGTAPIIFSLIGDFFPPTRRAQALASMNLAASLGIAGGQTLAGMLGPSLGWRAPFLIVASLGLMASVLYGFLGEEPRRGQQEEGLQALHDAGIVYEERLRWQELPQLLRIRTNRYTLLSALCGAMPWAVILVYLNDYLAQDLRFSVPQATLLIMAIGVAGLFGNMAGGFIGQRLLNRTPHKLALFCAATTLSAMPLLSLVLHMPVQPGIVPIKTLAVGALAGFLIMMPGPGAMAMQLNTNPPNRRGALASLNSLCLDLGRGLGAWIVGVLASSLGRQTAFHLAFLMWLPAGLCLLALARSFPREQESMQKELRALATARTAEASRES